MGLAELDKLFAVCQCCITHHDLALQGLGAALSASASAAHSCTSLKSCKASCQQTMAHASQAQPPPWCWISAALPASIARPALPADPGIQRGSCLTSDQDAVPQIHKRVGQPVLQHVSAECCIVGKLPLQHGSAGPCPLPKSPPKRCVLLKPCLPT